MMKMPLLSSYLNYTITMSKEKIYWAFYYTMDLIQMLKRYL